jgi:hypothetical protein
VRIDPGLPQHLPRLGVPGGGQGAGRAGARGGGAGEGERRPARSLALWLVVPVLSAAAAAAVAAPASAATTCSATYRVASVWPGAGDIRNFQAEITIRNTGAAATNSWTVRVFFASSDVEIVSYWNARRSTVNAALFNNAVLNGRLPVGAVTTMGFNARVSDPEGGFGPDVLGCTAT